MVIKPASEKTIAQIARELKTKVSITTLAEKRGMKATNFRLNDGSSIKLLEGPEEVDCVIMKHGKVLSAKGTFVENPIEAKIIADNAVTKIANRRDIQPEFINDYDFVDYSKIDCYI